MSQTTPARTHLDRCLACSGRPVRRIVGSAEMLVCPTCGMGRLPIPAGSADYWSRHHNDSASGLQENYWTVARTGLYSGALALLNRERGRGRLLDLGGGIGHFAHCALADGWDAYSMDVSNVAAAAAAVRIGSERSLSSLSPTLHESFDVVTLWCVVAHVPDPQRLLADAVGLLKRGGHLLVTTPNFLFQARYAWLLARLGRPLDFAAHDHLLHFTPAALDRVLADAGVGQRRYTYVGITEDCLFDRRMARWLVPVKRMWNTLGVGATRLGLPPLSSELQVLAVKPATSAGA